MTKRFDDKLNDNADFIIQHLQKQLRNDRIYNTIITVVVIMLLIVTLILTQVVITNREKNAEYKKELIQDENILTLEYSIGYWFIHSPDSINDSSLYKLLVANNAWYPDILIKQAKLESANYTSNIYKTNNNLYGMKKVGKRQTTQSEDKNGYGVYNNWCLSVLDRLLWDMFTFNNEKPSEEDYLKAMEIYAEDPNYIKKLK